MILAMGPWGITLTVILCVLIVGAVALYFLGKKAQKKHRKNDIACTNAHVQHMEKELCHTDPPFR